MLVTRRNRQIAELCPDIDELIEDKFRNYFKQRNKWDLYIDFCQTFNSRSIILEKILNPKYLLIFNKKNKIYYSAHTIKNYNAHALVIHQHLSDYLEYSVLKPFISAKDNQYRLNIDIVANQDYWQENKIKILLSPQGSCRQISCDELACLINSLDKETKANCCFLLVVTENPETYWAELEKKLATPLNLRLLPKVSLKEYLSCLKAADLVVSVDTATVHFACALNKRLLAFYANQPANLARWKPKVNENIPYKLVLGKTTISNQDTCGFPMQEAGQWLEKQITLLHKGA